MTATIKDLIENLERLPNTDAVRRKNNSYAQNQAGAIIALSLSNSEVNAINFTEEDRNLEHLYLNANKSLASIHFHTALPHLKHLYLEECALKELIIPTGFSALEQLYVRKNKLKQVVFEGDCPALELLDLSENELKKINLTHDFGQLKYLYLNRNHLKELHLSTTLVSLNTLHLQNNRLKEVPDHIIEKVLSDATTFETINLAGNAPKNIPKVFVNSKNCIENALLWFQELQGKTDFNTIIKLMLIGNGNAGKTSLVCALKNGNCPHDKDYHLSTHGIQIETLPPIKGVDFNVWDFGGQEVYHGTHKLFMESDALQLILFDPETEERARLGNAEPDRTTKKPVKDNQVEYWYDTTQGKSKDSLFVFVQNKMDILPDKDIEIEKFASSKKSTFKQISAKTGKKLGSFREELFELAEDLPAYRMKMPASWLVVRQFFTDNLAKKENNVKLITEQDFIDKCTVAKVGPKTIGLLRTYLHHNGFLYDNKNLKNEQGEQVIIADQRWALQAIYKPLDRYAEHYNEFKEDEGRIRVRRLFEVFDETEKDKEAVIYTLEDKWLFLAFMKSCGLCFKMNQQSDEREKSLNDKYIFPEFLPLEPTQLVINTWVDKKDYLVFRNKLPYRDYGLIQSFIVSLGRKTALDNIWKLGIHIAEPDVDFKVALEQEGKQYTLMVYIDKEGAKDWLVSIFDAFRRDVDREKWELSKDQGQQYQLFDMDKWKRELEQKVSRAAIDRPKSVPANRKAADKAKQSSSAKLVDRIEDKDQTVKEILFVMANPSDEAELATFREHRIINTEMKTGKRRDRYELIQPLLSATFSTFIRALLHKPTVIHFAGHGCSEGIIIEDDRGQGEVLRNEILKKIFKTNGGGIELVLLNCCYSNYQAEFISSLGIIVIGYNSEIADPAAMEFAKGFYLALGEGADYKQAYGNGMIFLENNHSSSISLLKVWENGVSQDW